MVARLLQPSGLNYDNQFDAARVHAHAASLFATDNTHASHGGIYYHSGSEDIGLLHLQTPAKAPPKKTIYRAPRPIPEDIVAGGGS